MTEVRKEEGEKEELMAMMGHSASRRAKASVNSRR
jgi:hypothetical protein